ncbi:MAG TPA: hypothetical protein VM243_02610 [Phycisphaerae bacterium]|nr:hypothetical protein [Phycisphaerae bacterium]
MPGLTKLQAVNKCLSAIHEWPAAALDTAGDTIITRAEEEVDKYCTQLQQKGFHENTEDDIELFPPDLQMSLTGEVTGTFIAGETVTETTSGATGTFYQIDTDMFLLVASGEFTGGETLTGSDSSATVTGDVPTAITEGQIVLAADVLEADTWGASAGRDVTIRDGKLFDRDNNTLVFTESLKMQLIRELPFAELSVGFRFWIACAAAVRFQRSHLGSKNADPELLQEMADARDTFYRSNADRADHNILRTTMARQIQGRGGTYIPTR